MSILSGDQIRREALRGIHLNIDPLPPIDRFQPASVDLTLDYHLAVPRLPLHDLTPSIRPYHVPNPKQHWTRIQLPEGKHYLLHPGAFVLASTREHVRLDGSLVGRVEGKSTPARWGLTVHTTAGFIDPGFDGPITLELKNDGYFIIELHPGDSICQLSIERLEQSTSHLYQGHYVNQQRPGLPV